MRSFFEFFEVLNLENSVSFLLAISFVLFFEVAFVFCIFKVLSILFRSYKFFKKYRIKDFVDCFFAVFVFDLLLFLMFPSPLSYLFMIIVPIIFFVCFVIAFCTVFYSPRELIGWHRKLANEKTLLKKAKIWPNEDIRPRFIPPAEPVDENWFLERCPDILRCVSLADDEKARCLIWSLKNLLPEVSYRVVSEMLYRLKKLNGEASLSAVINHIVDLHREDQRWLGYFLREFSSEGTYGILLSIETSADEAVAFYNQITQVINLVRGEVN